MMPREGPKTDFHGTFRVETAHGTVLAADIASRQLVHTRPENIGAARPAALVHIPAQSVDLAFFLFDNPGGVGLAFRYSKPTGPIVVMRRQRLPEPGMFAFHHPHKHNYLLVRPDINQDGTGTAEFAGYEVAGWETFRLLECAGERLTVAVRYQISLIQRVLTTPPFQVVALLGDATAAERPVLADLLSGVFAPAAAETLVAHLIGDRDHLDAFAALLPDDPWATRSLPALQRFLSARRARFAETSAHRAKGQWPPVTPDPAGPPTAPQPRMWGRLLGRRATAAVDPPSAQTPSAAAMMSEAAAWRTIGPDLDRLGPDGHDRVYVSLPHQCIAVARRVVPPISDLCVLATARNEGLKLLEWLAYHRSIGVDRVFLYTNDNTDGSQALLRALAESGEISLIESEVGAGGEPQGKAYGHALSMMPELLDYRWCAIIDLDEMIGFETDRFTSLKEYLAWQERRAVDAIALSWVMMTSSGATRWQDNPMLYRFRQRVHYTDAHVKSIVRPRLFHHAGAHMPITDVATSLVCRDAAGDPYPFGAAHSPAPRDNPAWIGHYFYLSAEEFIWKFARGRGHYHLPDGLPAFSVPQQFIEAFLRQHNDPAAMPDDRMLSCASGMSAELARLRRLPGIAEAHATIITHYQARAAAMEGVLRSARERATPSEITFHDLLLAPQSS